MGFGLHYGWSVEGAIGSILKIDASYLRCAAATARHRARMGPATRASRNACRAART